MTRGAFCICCNKPESAPDWPTAIANPASPWMSVVRQSAVERLWKTQAEREAQRFRSNATRACTDISGREGDWLSFEVITEEGILRVNFMYGGGSSLMQAVISLISVCNEEANLSQSLRTRKCRVLHHGDLTLIRFKGLEIRGALRCGFRRSKREWIRQPRGEKSMSPAMLLKTSMRICVNSIRMTRKLTPLSPWRQQKLTRLRTNSRFV